MILKDGVTIGTLITILQQVEDKSKPFLVASDDEQNKIFKGVYIEQYDDSVIIGGLSGFEVDE